MTDITALQNLREVRRVLRRRRLVIVAPAILAVAVAVVRVLTAEPLYRSAATLALEAPSTLTPAVERTAGVERASRERVRLITKRVESSDLLEAVAVQAKLHEMPRLVARARRIAKGRPEQEFNDILIWECVEFLRRMISVRPEGRDIFQIGVVSTDPDFAYRIAKSVSEEYIQASQEGRLRQSEETFNFAREQMAIYEQKLEEKRHELSDYEQQLALHPLDAGPVQATNINRVRGLIAEADADREYLRSRQELVRSQIAAAGLQSFMDLNLLRSARLDALKATISELERHLALTMLEYAEGEPAVESIKTQIAVRSQQMLSEVEGLAQQRSSSLGPANQQLLVDYEFTRIGLETLERRRQELEEFLSKYAADLTGLPAAEFRLAKLREEVQSAQRLYETWLEQANSTQIAKAVQATNVGNPTVLLEPARRPLAPFAPERGRIILLAIGLGIGLGIAAAVVSEYFDLSLRTAEEIETLLGVPVLGAVPRTQARVLAELDAQRRRRVWILVTSTVFTALGAAAAVYWALVVQKGSAG